MKISFSVVALGLLLAGCSATSSPFDSMLTASSAVRGTGYASISIQPGRTAAQRQLMAMRAARLAAMRELAEKIHGLDIDGYVSVNESVIQNDSVRGTINGLVRGARLVSVVPKGDIYEVTLEVEPSDMAASRRDPRPVRYR